MYQLKWALPALFLTLFLGMKDQGAAPLPVEKIVTMFQSLNTEISEFFAARDIQDIQKFSDTADKETLDRVGKEFEEFRRQKGDEAFDTVFSGGGIYKISGECASIITDVRYDESQIGRMEVPPVLSVSVSVICKQKDASGTGTFSLELVPTKKSQVSLEKSDYTIIGVLDASFLQNEQAFAQYVRDGVMDSMVVKIAPLENEKANWSPFVREKKEGIFQVYGELIELGTRRKKP